MFRRSVGSRSPPGRPDAARDRHPLGAQLHGHEVRPRARLPARSRTRRFATRRPRSSSSRSLPRASARSGSAARPAARRVRGRPRVWLNQLSYVYALDVTTATTAALILGTLPIFTALIARLVGIERLVAALLDRGRALLRGRRPRHGRLRTSVSANLKGDLLAVLGARRGPRTRSPSRRSCAATRRIRLSAVVLLHRLGRAPAAEPRGRSETRPSTSARSSGSVSSTPCSARSC